MSNLLPELDSTPMQWANSMPQVLTLALALPIP
jgi:hypothetical protein